MMGVGQIPIILIDWAEFIRELKQTHQTTQQSNLSLSLSLFLCVCVCVCVCAPEAEFIRNLKCGG